MFFDYCTVIYSRSSRIYNAVPSSKYPVSHYFTLSISVNSYSPQSWDSSASITRPVTSPILRSTRNKDMDVPFGNDDRPTKDKREGKRRYETFVDRVMNRSSRKHPVYFVMSLVPERDIP